MFEKKQKEDPFKEEREELKRLREKVDELKKQEDFTGLKIWTVEDWRPIELEIPENKLQKEFERIREAIDTKQKTITIKDFCVAIDKITSFKKVVKKGDTNV